MTDRTIHLSARELQFFSYKHSFVRLVIIIMRIAKDYYYFNIICVVAVNMNLVRPSRTSFTQEQNRRPNKENTFHCANYE